MKQEDLMLKKGELLTEVLNPLTPYLAGLERGQKLEEISTKREFSAIIVHCS